MAYTESSRNLTVNNVPVPCIMLSVVKPPLTINVEIQFV